MIQDANSEEVGPERDCTEEKYLIAILIVSPLEFRTNCKGEKKPDTLGETYEYSFS